MTKTWKAGLRHRVVTVGALAALGVALIASLAIAADPPADAAAAARGGDVCPTASVPAAESTVKDMRKSIRCLINEERAVHGIGKLARNFPLQDASQRHAKVMVATDCLAHRCPGEADLETRLGQAGYFNGVKSWTYAENTGCGLSADAMIANWMASTFHRVNILDEEFRDIGVGVSQERVAGRCKRDFATFAVVFGNRTP